MVAVILNMASFGFSELQRMISVLTISKRAMDLGIIIDSVMLPNTNGLYWILHLKMQK